MSVLPFLVKVIHLPCNNIFSLDTLPELSTVEWFAIILLLPGEFWVGLPLLWITSSESIPKIAIYFFLVCAMCISQIPCYFYYTGHWLWFWVHSCSWLMTLAVWTLVLFTLFTSIFIMIYETNAFYNVINWSIRWKFRQNIR